MLANVLEFKLKREVVLDKNLKAIEKESIHLYACHDGIWSWVANVNSYQEALEKVKPENIDDLFRDSMCWDQAIAYKNVLLNHPNYYFFDEVFVYNTQHEEDDEYTNEDRELDHYNDYLNRLCSGEENDEI